MSAKVKPRKRINIKGHYLQVRQRSTKKGKKGTILGKWQPIKGKKRRYACKLPSTIRMPGFCAHKKAGSYCLTYIDTNESCPHLTVTYQQSVK